MKMLSLILPGHYSLLKESPAEVKELETAGTTGKCHAPPEWGREFLRATST